MYYLQNRRTNFHLHVWRKPVCVVSSGSYSYTEIYCSIKTFHVNMTPLHSIQNEQILFGFNKKNSFEMNKFEFYV